MRLFIPFPIGTGELKGISSVLVGKGDHFADETGIPRELIVAVFCGAVHKLPLCNTFTHFFFSFLRLAQHGECTLKT